MHASYLSLFYFIFFIDSGRSLKRCGNEICKGETNTNKAITAKRFYAITADSPFEKFKTVTANREKERKNGYNDRKKVTWNV